MRSIKDSIIHFMQSEDIKRDLYSIIQPIYSNIYNEMYPYIWLLCIYLVVVTFIILMNLLLLVRVLNQLGGLYVTSIGDYTLQSS